MDLKHKIKEVVMSEFAYDLSKYEDEGDKKIRRVTEKLEKLTSIPASQRTELLLLLEEITSDDSFLSRIGIKNTARRLLAELV